MNSVFSAQIVIDSEAALVPRLLNITGWLRAHGVTPLSTEYALSPLGLKIKFRFATEAEARAVAAKFEGEFVSSLRELG